MTYFIILSHAIFYIANFYILGVHNWSLSLCSKNRWVQDEEIDRTKIFNLNNLNIINTITFTHIAILLTLKTIVEPSQTPCCTHLYKGVCNIPYINFLRVISSNSYHSTISKLDYLIAKERSRCFSPAIQFQNDIETSGQDK